MDAIHPGYGFLAENAHFAEVCESCKIKFIGPPASAMHAMGDKNSARASARKAGVSVTPGSDGIVETEAGSAARSRKKIGYPVMIKAVAGGGGRGMRAAHNEASLVQRLSRARETEAEKAFGNGEVYIEKLIVNPHHIEFQIMADQHGNTVHLGERDCSIQRRNQKVIEECPSPLISRRRCARRWATPRSSWRNRSATRMPARWSSSSIDEGHYYFIEMNTRIQVEHTITEEVYGCDLVKEQITIAAGEQLSPHVAQCRCRAPTPSNAGSMPRIRRRNFQPSPGRIDFYYAPGGRGVRIDSHAYTGYTVPPYYDSMIAKLIAVGATRAVCHRPDAARARRISHHRDQDDDSVSQRDHAQRRFPERQLRHRVRRAHDELGNFELRPSNGRLRD